MSASPRPQPAEITCLLLAWGDGDPDAAERLLPLFDDHSTGQYERGCQQH